jgi:hypothetical protein
LVFITLLAAIGSMFSVLFCCWLVSMELFCVCVCVCVG